MFFQNILYFLCLLFTVHQLKPTSSRFLVDSYKQPRLNKSILNLLRNKHCVEISVNQEYEWAITALLLELKNTSTSVVVKNTNFGILHECTFHIQFISNLSNTTLNSNFLENGLTVRNKTVIFILTHNQTRFSGDFREIFGDARVIVVSQDDVRVLESPSLKARRLCEITEEYSNDWGDIESKTYLQGGTIRVATFDCPLFSIIDNITGDIQGIEAEIVKEVARQLNLTICLVPLVNSTYNKYGFKLDNGTWVGGVMGSLNDRDADLGFCALWMTYDRDEVVEQTMPWGRVDLSFLVPRPRQRREHWHTIFLPFHHNTWMAIMCTFLLASLCQWLLLKTSSVISLKKSETDLSSVMVGMFGALTQCSSTISHGQHSPLVVCWYVTCVILVALYSSNIVSRLTLPLYTERIDSVKQLVQQGFIWGRSFKSDTGNLLNLQDHWHRKFRAEHFRMIKPEEIHSLIMSGKFAFSVQVLEKYYVFSSDFYHLQDSELVTLRVMGDVTNQYMVSIQVARGSPLYPAVNLQIQWLLALGHVDYWKRDVTRRYNRGLILQLMVDTDQPVLSEPSPLALYSFQGAFFFLSIGLSGATVAFLCELYNGKKLLK